MCVTVITMRAIILLPVPIPLSSSDRMGGGMKGGGVKKTPSEEEMDFGFSVFTWQEFISAL